MFSSHAIHSGYNHPHQCQAHIFSTILPMYLHVLLSCSSTLTWLLDRSRSGDPRSPRSRPCSLKEQYFKCGIFRDYDAPQRRVSNSEAPVLAGGIPVFLRGSQFSGASELKEVPVSKLAQVFQCEICKKKLAATSIRRLYSYLLVGETTC